jgi:hypothetical protein
VANVADALALFTQPVMAGTPFAQGELVYRPFASLTFGLDYAIWGLDAVGYHLTNVILHVGVVLVAWWLMSLLGLRWWSGLAGAAVVALHPVVLATAPVIARRDSLLPVLGTGIMACLLLAARRSCGARRLGLWLGACVAMLVGLFSKESAFAAVAMTPLLLLGAGIAEQRRFRNASGSLFVALPLFAVAVLVLGMRTRVLGGLGGHAQLLNPDVEWLDPEKWIQILGAYTRYLIWAFASASPAPTEIWPRVGAEILFVLAVTLVWLPMRHAVLAAVGTLWVIGFGIFCAVLQIGTIGFVAYFGLVGLGLAFGSSLEGALYRLRCPLRPGSALAPRSRAASLVLLTGLTIAGASWLWTGPLVRNYHQWQLSGDVNDLFLQALDQCVGSTPRATQLAMRGLPEDLDDGPEETRLLTVTLLEDYTVQSALRLAFPDREFSVVALSSQTLRTRRPDLAFACTASGESIQFDVFRESSYVVDPSPVNLPPRPLARL